MGQDGARLQHHAGRRGEYDATSLSSVCQIMTLITIISPRDAIMAKRDVPPCWPAHLCSLRVDLCRRLNVHHHWTCHPLLQAIPTEAVGRIVVLYTHSIIRDANLYNIQHHPHPLHDPGILHSVISILRLLPTCDILRSPARLLRSLCNCQLLHVTMPLHCANTT